MNNFLNLAIRLMAGQDATEAMTEIREERKTEKQNEPEERVTTSDKVTRADLSDYY